MLRFPGMNDDDIAMFLVEAEEQLQLLEEGLLQLEQGGSREGAVTQLFRAAHTLKGSSATLGHERMAKLTHSMESVLDLVRKNRISISSTLMGLFFECLDTLRALNGEVATANESGADIEGLIARLMDVLADAERDGGQGAADPASSPAIRDGSGQRPAGLADSGDQRYHSRIGLTVRFDAKCSMPSVRAYQVIDRLSALCKIVSTDPGLSNIEAGVELSSVAIEVEHDFDDIEPLIAAVRDITDVASVTVTGDDTPQHAEAIPPAGAEAVVEAVAATPTAAIGAATPGAPGAPAASVAAPAASTVRVDVARLDTLSNLVAELVIDRTHLAQLEARLAEKHGGDELVNELNRTSTHIGRLTTELQEAINKARMFPIDNVFRRFPRMVRDLAHKQGKEIDFVIEGGDTELDRSVSEEVGDPLIHLLRNAIGHGIEPPAQRVKSGKPPKGRVRLSAFHQENYIVIEVEDDGRGIDAESVKASAIRKGLITEDAASRLSDRDAIRLIFLPGLSTATSADDVSGRGVGMDIIKRNIEKLSGTISIRTEVGRGTVFTVKLPLTLAIIRALLVKVHSRVYAIPLSSVAEITRMEPSEVKTVHGREAILLRGEVVPLMWMEELMKGQAPESEARGRRAFVVIASSHEGQVGLVVHSLIGEMEIVIKSLGSYVGAIPGVSGVTVLGDGSVALIVDVSSLVKMVVEERHGAVRA